MLALYFAPGSSSMAVHIALEVGDVEAALAFYGKIFDFTLRGKGKGQAFIDMGDQFVALMESKTKQAGPHRHFGIVVDDRSAVRDLVTAAGGTLLPGPFLDFVDPWGNRYLYFYYQAGGAARWQAPSYVLYSTGPDGLSTVLPGATGVFTGTNQTSGDNADNIYADKLP